MLIIFYWVPKSSKFPGDKWRFDNTDPHSSVALSKRNVFLLIYSKLKTNFMPRVNYYTWGVHLRKSVNKRKIQFSFSKLSASAYERVSAYGDVKIQSLTGTVKRGFKKPFVSRAVRLQECSRLAEK